jgi:hypothetical protein
MNGRGSARRIRTATVEQAVGADQGAGSSARGHPENRDDLHPVGPSRVSPAGCPPVEPGVQAPPTGGRGREEEAVRMALTYSGPVARGSTPVGS